MRPIHPFPARMAPDVISRWLAELPNNSVVLDPMCGSGVVLRQARAAGHRAYGFDVDPLAVLMSRVWTSGADVSELPMLAERVVRDARSRRARYTSIPAVASCAETKSFVEYWFAEPQRTMLARISHSLMAQRETLDRHHLDALLLCLSRTIVTKHAGASLAWDVSHSRPHKKRETNDYDVGLGFIRAARRIADLLSAEDNSAPARVARGDCRSLDAIQSGAADAIITSPPYLNAIDYLRGHRLALVWMGFTIPYLRNVRATAVGTENSANALRDGDALVQDIETAMPGIAALPQRNRRIVHKYASDSRAMLAEMRRLLKPGGTLVLVLADSIVRGIEVQSSAIFGRVATQQGFRPRAREVRDIPQDRRYLPIHSSSQALARRMKHEIIQVFEAA